MSESINPFFASGYTSAAIAKLFAALPAPGAPPASSPSSCQSGPATSGNGATARNSSVIPAANGTEPMASNTGTAEFETQTASFATVAPSPAIHDLAIEEMELTGNNAGLARPSVGSSKFVDALMQLATGPDMALSIAARNLLPRLAGNGEYDANGQAIVTYRYDPQHEDLTLDNLPDAAGFAAGDWWSDRAIANIASTMANGEQPDTADENFLRQRLFGSFSFTATDEVEANGADFYSVSAGSGYFDKQIIDNHGIEALPDCYVTAASATYGEF